MEHKEVLKEREFQVVFLYSKRGGGVLLWRKVFQEEEFGGGYMVYMGIRI